MHHSLPSPWSRLSPCAKSSAITWEMLQRLKKNSFSVHFFAPTPTCPQAPSERRRCWDWGLLRGPWEVAEPRQIRLSFCVGSQRGKRTIGSIDNVTVKITHCEITLPFLQGRKHSLTLTFFFLSVPYLLQTSLPAYQHFLQQKTGSERNFDSPCGANQLHVTE